MIRLVSSTADSGEQLAAATKADFWRGLNGLVAFIEPLFWKLSRSTVRTN
jgi:hypothetical protein